MIKVIIAERNQHTKAHSVAVVWDQEENEFIASFL